MDVSDIIGKRFEKLEVVEFLRSELMRTNPKVRYRYVYLCKCECGKTKEVSRDYLLLGQTKSCGCLKQRKGKESKSWNGCGDISGRMWYSILEKAKQRNLDVEIDINDAWEKYESQGGKCAMTGWSISLSSNKGSYKFKTASLDRIDNSKGYTKENIQWLHKDVNWMKGRFDSDRFKEICKAVTEYKGGV